MIHVAIAGCSGRMGQALLQALYQHSKLKLTGGLVRPGSEFEDQDLGALVGKHPLDLLATSELNQAFQLADVIIDFTLPNVLLSHLDYYCHHQKKLVIGTTGMDEHQLILLEQASQDIPIVLAPNMSLGVNVCLSVVQKMAQVLNNYDVEIWEAHHRHKKDAPSGTALKLGEVIAQAKDLSFEECANFNRHQDLKVRGEHEIGFATTRGGSIFGDHTVLFAGDAERIELTHRAQSRQAFAEGALVACQWVANQKPGCYSMQEVLGLV